MATVRRPIPSDVQAAVLVQSRRRCCICFGLDRNTSLKSGQIAHVDGNPANPSVDNLAFLCFDHHDKLDSTTRQSKNFTVAEVKAYRAELYQALRLAFGQEVSFGDVRTFADPIGGQYIREIGRESAEVRVSRLQDGRFHVGGLALWGVDREYGPNLGELDFIGELDGQSIAYRWEHGDGSVYRAVLTFRVNGLSVEEENWVGVHGMNVTFAGDYERVT